MAEKEIRALRVPVKVNRNKDGSIKNITGYPIVYGKDSVDMGFIEQVAKGAATKALRKSDIRGLKNHDENLIFGRKGINLKFKEDDHGVSYVATPIDTTNYREIAAEIDAGMLTGQSFGFTIKADEWSDLNKDTPRRTITEIGEIFDVGPVTFPAYGDTDVALRKINNTDAALQSLERARAEYEERKQDDGDEKKSDTCIMVNDDETETIYEFTDFEQFDRIALKMASLRNADEHTPTERDAHEDPTDEHTPTEKEDDSLPTGEEIFERINQATKER